MKTMRILLPGLYGTAGLFKPLLDRVQDHFVVLPVSYPTQQEMSYQELTAFVLSEIESVLNKSGKSVHLPTNLLNKLGYNIEFNSKNKYKKYSAEFVAMAAHIVALHRQAKKNGHDLWRVIFAPELQPNLYNTQYADYLRANIQFSKKRSWVRHNEHYHVDFKVACEE